MEHLEATNRLQTEHGPLVDISRRLVEQLYWLEGRLNPGEVQHYQHDIFAKRAASLGSHLEGALMLVERSLYPAAFSQLRTALEHQAIDLLLLLGVGFEQVLDISDEEFEKLRADRSMWPRNAADIRRTRWRGRNRKVIEWGRVPVKDSDGSDSGHNMSPYWSFMERYDPFFAIEPEAESPFGEDDSSEDYRKNQRALWRDRLSWVNIRHNLVLNDIVAERDVARLHIHYAFLSAYAHPVSFRAWDSIFGRYRSSSYDHYASELALLYVCYLAMGELRAFAQMALRPPQVDLSDWDIVEVDLKRAEVLSAHAWFPGQAPSAYDRLVAANRVHWAATKNEEARPEVTPDTIEDSRVPYYSNPLARLRDLHRSQHELTTGFVYESPWERRDALFPP